MVVAPLASAAASQLPTGVRFRPGRPEDASLLFKAVLREKMNPLGLKPERFTVAEREGGGAVVGFGQASQFITGSEDGGATAAACMHSKGRMNTAQGTRPGSRRNAQAAGLRPAYPWQHLYSPPHVLQPGRYPALNPRLQVRPLGGGQALELASLVVEESER